MVIGMLKRAAGSAKSAVGVSSTKDDKERRLVPVLQKGQKLFVVEVAPGREGDLILSDNQQAPAALIALFQGSKKAPGPLPLFNGTTNIVDLVPQREQKRSSDYVDDKGVENYVVTFHLCTDLGQPTQAKQIVALEEHGYSLLPLQQHPKARLIKEALRLD